MIINTLLEYKATQIQPERCQIDVVVTLDHWEFEQLRNSTLDDFDFIKDSLDKLPVTNDNTRRCIMALDESADDGILIDPQGYNYPRYAAYVSNAKQLLTLELYPSLQSYNDAMRNLVEEITQLALNSHQNGLFSYDFESAEYDFQPNILDKNLLADMLEERPELISAEYNDGAFVMEINKDYIQKPALSYDDVRLMCARHILWQLGHDAGKQANFSGKTIKNFDFRGMDLSRAVMDRTSFICCDFSGVSLDNAYAAHTLFDTCRFVETGVNSVNLIGSKIINSNCYDATFWNCECTDTVFKNSDLTKTEFINCRLTDTDFSDIDTDSFLIRDCTEEPYDSPQKQEGDGGLVM